MTAPISSSSHHHTSGSAGHRWPWLAVPVGLVAIVLWPLQALAIAMLVTAALMAVSIYAVFTEHGAVSARLRPRLDQVVPVWVGALLVLGIVMTMVWPTTLTPIAFGLLVTACAAWLLSEWVLGRRDDAHGRGHLT